MGWCCAPLDMRTGIPSQEGYMEIAVKPVHNSVGQYTNYLT